MPVVDVLNAALLVLIRAAATVVLACEVRLGCCNELKDVLLISIQGGDCLAVGREQATKGFLAGFTVIPPEASCKVISQEAIWLMSEDLSSMCTQHITLHSACILIEPSNCGGHLDEHARTKQRLKAI